MKPLTALLFLFLLVSGAPAADYSGMVQMPDRGTYLVVHDTKTGPEPPWVSRIGVLSLSPRGELAYQSLPITDWGAGEEQPNDLESCCPIPGRPDEYLIAESGYYQGRFGRLFRIRVTRLPGSVLYHGQVLGVLRPEPLPDAGYTTPGPRQFEGMACLPSGSDLLLVLGRRGGEGEPGALSWGRLDLEPMAFEPLGEEPLSFSSSVRACADLLFFEGRLWSVASRDPGDLGPFWSAVYPAGTFRFDGSRADFESAEARAAWRLDGLKVEALAECDLPDSPLCIGTDDEDYGGVWRPLPQRR